MPINKKKTAAELLEELARDPSADRLMVTAPLTTDDPSELIEKLRAERASWRAKE
jgi:hypothetical protein